MADKIERVLVVAAHPDDAEAGAGGSIAKLVKQGAQVTYVIVTNGSTGSGDRAMTRERLVPIREAEQRDAAKTLGVTHVEFLRYPDAEVENTRDVRRDITRQIRKWRPDLVITHSPLRTYNLYASHRDHRVTGAATLDCVYPLARDWLSFPELMPEYEPFRVGEVHAMQWQSDSHQLAVDITDTMDRKLEALARHRSQFPDFPAVEKRFRERCATLGKPYGYAYAETFDRATFSR